jgi:4a-hydroxytetrahydrobiopterin dehydratase
MWTETNNQLYQKFSFNDFVEAFGFMVKVAMVAEKMNHHPTWTNCWNRVEIWLSTHDAGNIITEKDRQLAATIEVIYEQR